MDKIKRPAVLGGVTIKVYTGCGNMYVQLNWYRGRLVEIFATLGRAGGCSACEMEGLMRTITLGLKYGVPLEEYIDQLKNLRCPIPVSFPKESAVMSCPDAIAVTLQRYGRMDIQSVVKLILGINGIYEKTGAVSVDSSAAPVADSVVDVAEGNGDIPGEVADVFNHLVSEREAAGLR